MPRKNLLFAFIVALLAIAACSKKATQPPPTSDQPLVEQGAADPPPKSIEEFRGKFAPGGIAAKYLATFSDGQIQSIEETRKESSQTGVYEFRGARLMKYHGAALQSAATLELEFDLQGKVLVARADNETASPEELTAIRDRAQALRSHAVSQHSVAGHGKVN